MLIISLAVVLVLGTVVALTRGNGGGHSKAILLGEPGPRAKAAIDAFFDRYVEPGGRVVRSDQGGDTVSEGQAYALLLAVARGDEARFERVWEWTKNNLQRPDGLLSWKWEKGRVVDPSPAADADLDAARALVQAGRRFDAPHLRREGERMAAGVLTLETIDVGGRLVLAAGPWAVERRIVNPSYVAPCSYAELEAATGEGRWRRLRESGYRMLEGLTTGGRLPPDWAQIDQDGEARPIGPPDQGGSPQYGLDAARVPFRLAEGCDEQGPALAAQLWPRLRDLPGQAAASAYGLDGTPVDDDEHPLGLVGAASAAKAAGDDDAYKRLLGRARSLARSAPTYYGWAWLALGEALLDSDGLDSDGLDSDGLDSDKAKGG